MRPAARLQAVIDILTALETTDQPVDRLLRDWFRTRRYAGSKDRAAIGERVFAIQRHRAELAWRMQSEAPRAVVIASVLADGESAEIYFTGDGYGPAPLTDAERAAIATMPPEPPLHVKGEYPAWLEDELRRAFGDALAAETLALQARAPVDLRANGLKYSRDAVLAALEAEGFEAAPTPHAPDAIRIAPSENLGQLSRSTLFADGGFEFQDEAAQIAALLVAPKPDMRVLDIAAGAGGKSLALAAASHNQAEIVASDIREEALEQLRLRAKRAGAHIRIEADPTGPFDAVLLDAPCSGTGTWRRQPELRWRLTPERLAELMATQDGLLDRAAALVGTGGRLIYATCSILPCENEDRVAAFLGRHAAFKSVSAAAVWRESTGGPAPPGMAEFFRASPLSTGTDGFFTAILARE